MPKTIYATLMILAVSMTLSTSPTVAVAEDESVEHVRAKYETQGYFDADFDADSDADDPAIWVHPSNADKSLVIGTLKNGGLAVFDLKGRELQRIIPPDAPSPDDEAGRFNNVDLLLGFQVGGKSTDLAVVSDRGRDKLVIYRIEKDYGSTRAPLSDVTAPDVPWVFSTSQSEVNEQHTAYGLATQRFSGAAGAIGFVTQRERARLAKLRFTSTSGGKVSYAVTDSRAFASSFELTNGSSWIPCMDEDGVEPQFEGMVIDKEAKHLYAAQEPVGIWRMNLDFSQPKLVERVRSYGQDYTRTFDPDEEEFVCEYTSDPGFGGKRLSADAEGLTIYYPAGDTGERYLFASSQGDDTFSAWSIAPDRRWDFQGSFTIGFGDDENEESDGSHVVSAALNSTYPRGLFVSQDGHDSPDELDDDGEVIPRTNFKFTPFDRIAKALHLDR